MEQRDSITVSECLNTVLKHFSVKCKDAKVLVFKDGHVEMDFMTHPLEILLNEFTVMSIEDYAELSRTGVLP